MSRRRRASEGDEAWVSTAPKPLEKAAAADDAPAPADRDGALEDGWYQVLRGLRETKADDEPQ